MEQIIHDEDILIAGAGISGLTTALGLHRLGIRSCVLEASDGPRLTGFAISLFTNAWRALDAVGVGDSLREKSVQIHGFKVGSKLSSMSTPSQATMKDIKLDKSECRCVKRKDLLETLERELPQGSIRYSSKIVSIEESGDFKLVHLADGSVFRTKVLIGCDGVNSVVAKWLGLGNAVSAGRSAIRGFAVYPNGHGFDPKLHAYFGGGVRCGVIPCDEKSLYWFCTFTPSLFDYDLNENDPVKMKQFVMNNVEKRISDVVEKTALDCVSCAHLKFRLPWNVLLGNIVKDNVCVAGDALHPMTPDLGQGGCSSLEDSVVLARCLGEALSNCNEEEVVEKTKRGLEKYAKERRWRCFSLISAAYLVGFIQESDNRVVSFLRRMFLTKLTNKAFVGMGDFDCGKLTVS